MTREQRFILWAAALALVAMVLFGDQTGRQVDLMDIILAYLGDRCAP